MTTFFEDDTVGLTQLIGSSQVLLGSDFPHGEGTAQPTDFIERVEGLPAAEIRQVLRGNSAALLGLHD